MKNDDSTVSSFENGDASSDSYRYTITAKYSRTGEEDGFLFETFDLEARGVDAAVLGGFFSGGLGQTPPAPVMKLNAFAVHRRTDGANDITDFMENPDGHVCLCDFDSLKDVNAALRIATKKGALACLAVKEPAELALSELPVFLVTKEAMNKLSHYEGTTVTFQKLRDESRESLDSPSDESLENFGGSSSFSQFNDAAMDESGMSEHVAWRDSTANSTGGVSNPINLAGEWTTKASDMVEETSLAFVENMTAEASSRLIAQQYTVTLNAHGNRSSSGASSWSVIVGCATDALRPSVSPGRSYQILVADVIRNKTTNQVSKLKQGPKDRVLVCTLEDVRDINQVQKLATDEGAVALFVVCPPLLPADIPLFVVDRTIIERMSGMDLLTAKFEKLDTKLPASSSIDHPLATPRRTYAAALSGEPDRRATVVTSTRHPSTVDREVTPSTESSTNAFSSGVDSGEEVDAHPLKRHAVYESGVAEKKSKRWYEKGWKAVKETFVGKDALFIAVKDRSTKSILSPYRKMEGEIDAILQAGHPTEIKNMVSEAERFLKRSDSALCHLAAAAYICENHSVSGECRDLEASVFAAISEFDVSGAEFKMLEPQPRRSKSDQSDRQAIRMVLYQFLVKHAASFAASLGCEKSTDSKLIKVLLFLKVCGLFRRKFEKEMWITLRAFVDPNVFNREAGALLVSVVGESTARDFVLCFQSDLNDYVETALEYADSKLHSLKECRYLGDIFLLLVEEQLGNSPVEADLLSAWSACLALLEREPCGEATRGKIITEFIARASLRSYGTYSALSELFRTVSLDHPEHGRVQECVKKQLSVELDSGLVDWGVMDALLRTARLANLLLSPPLRMVTLTFVDKAMSSWSCAGHKILLIDGLLQVFVRQEGASNFFRYERRFRGQLDRFVETENGTSGDTAALAAVLRFAATEKSLFVVADTDITFQVVAESFATMKSARAIVRDPSSVRDLAYTGDSDAKLYQHVVNVLYQGILNQCNTMDKASIFYGAVASGALAENLALRSMAKTVFVSKFKKWNPTQITDIQSSQKKVVDVLFAAESLESEPGSSITACRDQVRRLVTASLKKYNSDEVTRANLDYMLSTAKSNVWCHLEKNSDIEFPSSSAIHEKLAEVDSLEGSIQRSLSVSIGDRTFSLAAVLREYGCVDHKIQDLLRNYEYLFLNQSDARSTKKSLREMKNDDRVAADLAKRGNRELCFCAYFIAHQSLLFRDRVLRNDGQAHTLVTLCNSVKDALAWFETAFGPISNFAGVCSAKTAFSALKSNLDSELNTLVNCSWLKISSTDVENFRLVLKLSDLSQPIQRFVSCCEQFDFEVVRSDSSFAELRKEVQDFYSSDPKVRGVEGCLTFTRSLCRILFRDFDQSQGHDLRDGLFAITPVLQLFSSIALYPDVWNYAKEMEWFGEEGLKMFYEEYNNVTNVLLGDSGSYEMSLLDIMAPVMRVVSALGSLRESSSSILTLFDKCASHEDIEIALKGGIEKHIRQVHSKLSDLKDWFSNGVDEIAAAHTLFSAANLSGRYSIAEQDGEESSKVVVDPFGMYHLTLTFEVDNGGSNATRQLQGDALDHFIQQLSLIQNENRTTSVEMQGFVDQYQVLTRAARNNLTMFSVGYEKAKISDFGCQAGSRFDDDANAILKASEVHLRNFTSWLTTTRENFKESLLFWTEELRDLHTLIRAAVDQNSDAPAALAESLARLEPLWDPKIHHRHTLHAAVQKCAAASSLRMTSASGGWLVEVSRFLGDLYLELGRRQELLDCSNRSDIVLHSYHCEDNDEAQVILKIVHHIYQDRPPWSFEILDGAVPCSYERMALFLERVKAFPVFRFVIVNVNLLESKVLEKLLSFFSDREIASLGISFHCIQRGEALHTAPWMSERSWDCDSLAALNSSPPNRNWQSRVFSELEVVSSKTSGSGKTRYIRDKFDSVDKSTAQVASVVIHEGSSVASIIQSLKEKFPGACQNRVLHVSFAFLPSREKRWDKWLREMNYFFFSMVALCSVYDPISTASFSFSGTWKILFELPLGPAGESAQAWLLANIPIIAEYSRFREPSCQYVIDEQARRVCTYLRAFSTGTINRKFEGTIKRIVLVLDCSGSMGGTPFLDAVRNAVSIFDTHVVEGDEFGVILYDNSVYTPIPLQTVGADKGPLRRLVQALPYYGAGTSMYMALSRVLRTLSVRDPQVESWIVCLTDGVSDSNDFDNFRGQLMATPTNLHVISVGINLDAAYEANLRDLCQKYEIRDMKGFFVRSDGTTTGMDNAFEVVKSRIPVSKTFDRDGEMSDDDCRQYMTQYLPSFVLPNDMISQSFWIRFLYRRVKVFDNNDSFNYNEKHESLGSSLMEVMLSEVERLLGENLRVDWLDSNHAQLIYDFTDPLAPEFRLVCTAPDKLDPALRTKLAHLDLPGFRIPTTSDLDQRATLDLFLSQALDIPLQTRSDGSKVLQCIDDAGFILTLDFTMKLLSIHERVACRIPCLIEGETGVSKSALTKMYSILRNSSLAFKARALTIADLEAIIDQLEDDGFDVVSTSTVACVEQLRQTILGDADSSALATRILALLQEKMANRPAFFAAPANTRKAHPESQHVDLALDALDFFSRSTLERTFFDINVDSSLTEADFVGMFQEIRATARKLQQCDSTIVVFLDEINTSSVLGLLKEVVIDRSIAGEQLEENIVVVAALNPPRAEIQSRGRERDLSYQWASGHYQVAALPGSMNKLKWSYGSLTHSQEKDFIYRRIEALHSKSMPAFLRASLTEVVSESHEIMRQFAAQNIIASIRRSRVAEDRDDMDPIEDEAKERARSVVSLRDIQRVFALFEFFFEDLTKDGLQASTWTESETQRRAMLLAVATVYYLRLDDHSRGEFISMIQSLPTEAGQTVSFLEILDAAMDTVIAGSEIPLGIAVTRGLRENIFVTLVCSLSQTPLLIVGPPGTSKTLSVNIVDGNANGTDSMNEYYGTRPRLSLFHYQCSKQSTSTEIAAVFAQAIQRQERIDERKHRCVVFMDEAGLPESERESLKVLHYLLEGHMSAKAKVGFVAISNHVLDAAKSNRCVMLLRQEPDDAEMQSISLGVLFDIRDDGRSTVHDVDIDGVLVSSQEFAAKLCMAYSALFHESSGLSHLVTFFGLRDYIYFLKAVRRASRTESTRLHTSVKTLVAALERNFNGVTAEELRQVSACFLKPFATLPLALSSSLLEEFFRHPMVVLKDALTTSSASNGGGELDRPRFKLVIDCTEDDSILRLLSKGSVAEVTKRSLYKLSNLPENVDLERLRLISGVKFAALQGSFAVLSQTEPINESFYDLFNQRFREVTGRDGKKTLYANIACGGISRRSLVRPDFECVVHVRESNMAEIPAPFLNRFEKYRLTLEDMLAAGWSRLGSMAIIVGKAQKRTAELAAVLQGRCDTFGWMRSQETLESLFVDMLPHLDRRIWDEQGDRAEAFVSSSRMLEGILCDFLHKFTSLQNVSGYAQYAIRMAQDVLPVDIADALEPLVSSETRGSSLQDSLQSIGSGQSDGRTITSIFSALIQMVITQNAMFRLLQLATPESIFSNRHNLPSDVVCEYFQQEHFSLKRLLMGLSTECSSLNILHTRSDQFIHAIPSLPADRGLSSEDSETVENVLKLVHEQGPHGLIIENLSRLRSEALVRGAIQTWAQHDTRHIFLLLVDMNHQHALDRTNFVRMVVEQHLSETTKKTFALLLHYSPSSCLQSQCYPALFLGGWQHFFLDSVGDGSSEFGVDRFVALACQDTSASAASLESRRECILQTIQALLPRILPYLASQKLFYSNQDMIQNESFYHRKNVLGRLMETAVGDCTIGCILCQKFASLWLDHALFQTTRSASEALLRGTTQLSLSMSIQSVLIQSFQVFLGAAMADANQWMNLDLVHHGSSNADVLKLFGLFLQRLPVLPFEELVLQRKQSSFTRLRPLPASRHSTAKPYFPFFNFISGYFDELVETAVERHVLATTTENSLVDLSVDACLCAVMDLIEQESGTDGNPVAVDEERRSLAKSIVHFVSKASDNDSKGLSLFERYLYQFLEWKLGCKADPFILNWLQSRLDNINAAGNILSIHVITRLEQRDVMKVVSFAALVESLREGAEASVAEPETSDLFAIIFDTLETAVAERKSLNSTQWSLLLSTALRRADAHLSGSCFDDEKLAYRLRRLSFFVLGDKLDFPLSVEDNHWLYGKDERLDSKEDYSLSRFMESFDVDSSTESLAVDMLLQHFLSPTWQLTTTVFKDDDLSYLIQRISEGKVLGASHQTAVSLLRTAGSGGGQQAFGFSCDVLLLINARLQCESLAIFMPDSKRACLPHFVPKWLRKESVAVGQDGGPANTTFFANYVHCFDEMLPTVVFDLFLSAFACEAENSTSEQLFLLLQREMDSELSLNRQAHTQLSRLRSVGGKSLRGTPLAAIALSARLLCFVAKVAHEFATEMNSLVFAGAYARDALALVNELMSLKQASWQSFFIGSILKLRGEGTLSALLSPGGVFSVFGWSQAWSVGAPTLQDGAIESLRLAESAWAEAVAEEERKARELRLCPHCGQPFIVAQANCGQFTCGRDAHQVHGQPALNNTVINNVQGCGQNFNLTNAPHYTSDEEILAPLRTQIAEEQSKLDRCQHAAELWDHARSIVIPPLVHFVKTENLHGSFLPSSQLLSAATNREQASPQLLVQILWESSNLVTRLHLLPDLIELYCWLHDTFRFLVTREGAFQLEMRELMTKEHLQQRFDLARVQHLLGLWERCRVGLNEILADTDQKVHWQCETVSIPFEKLESAKLVSLLSEGQFPTDGNDFLFLIINETVDLYNVFAEKLSAFTASTTASDDHRTIPPKHIIRGLAGALKIGAVTPLTKQELNWMAESCWNSEEQVYDSDRLRFLLQNAINLFDRPARIANPLDHLRERFCFRDDGAPDCMNAQTSVAIIKQNGLFFANRQDAQLVDEVQQLLAALDVTVGDQGVRRTLIDNFHSLDYNSLRAMLEGSRSLFDLLLSNGRNEFQTIGSALDENVRARDATEQDSDPLQALGFPKMSGKQSRLVLSLDAFQTVEFVNYAAQQLASEAYLFAGLPLYMTDPLSDDTANEIKAGIDSLCSGRNVEAAVQHIDEFVRDVLSFYESQFVQGAAKTNSSLRTFLSRSNFCDGSDPVFAALPTTVSLRHYASLRQLLHQVKLSFMFRLSSDVKDAVATCEEQNESLTTTTRGRCWLWEDEEFTYTDINKKESEQPTRQLRGKLWFERALSATEMNAVTDTEAVEVVMEELDAETAHAAEPRRAPKHAEHQNEEISLEEEQDPEDAECRAATVLQRWWRLQMEMLCDMDVSDEESSSQSTNKETEQDDCVVPASGSFEMLGNASDDSNNHSSMMEIETSYGKPEDERDMRIWLDNHNLPQTTADAMLELGARCIDDVCMLVQEVPELLGDLRVLDQMKLRNAVAAAISDN